MCYEKCFWLTLEACYELCDDDDVDCHQGCNGKSGADENGYTINFEPYEEGDSSEETTEEGRRKRKDGRRRDEEGDGQVGGLLRGKPNI